MAKHKKHTQQPPAPAKTAPNPPTANRFSLRNLLLAGIAVAITLIVFLPALENGLTNWDDKTYLLENEYLYHYNWDTAKFFFTNYYFANYHPLVMLTYMWEFNHYKLDPWIYHATSLCFHLLNVALVYWVVRKLTQGVWAPAIVAILFGIHPMHVESVAWAAERKDVMYTFFYLISYYFYLKHSEESKPVSIFLAFSFLAFVLSCLSKSAAVVLPVVFLLTDYFQGRKFILRTWLEKLPFLVVSVIIGVVAVKAQQTSNAIADFGTFTILQRIMFASYSTVMYLTKMIVPFSQSNFYPYPFLVKGGFFSNFFDGEILPDLFYVAPAIALIILLLVVLTMKHTRTVAFGFGFFLINVALVLQVVSVGNAIMAERYTYVSYLGPFIAAGIGVDYLVRTKSRWMWASVLFAAGFTIFFIIKTTQRIPVWKDSNTLWTDFIGKYPTVHDGYVNRGTFLVQLERFDDAFQDFNMGIKLNPNYPKSYANRGNIHSMNGRHDEALADYNKAIELDPEYFDAYFNRAINHSIRKDFDKAFADYNKAISINPNNSKTYVNRAYASLERGDFTRALADSEEAIARNPENPQTWMYKALAFHNLKRYEEAINAYNQVNVFSPDNAVAFFNRSMCYKELGRLPEAIAQAEQAKNLGHSVPEAYLQSLKSAK